MKTVAYQGEAGAYSESAALNYFSENINLLPSPTFDAVFRKVKNGEADFGVVPVENSLYGSVFETYDLLRQYSFKITGELKLRINHYLISDKRYPTGNLKKIYSHPQALGQCSAFLNSLKNVSVIPVYDTAGAVKILSEKKENLDFEAAIASKRAAEVYGLKIIRGNIQNNSENFTRFLVIAKKTKEIPDHETKTSICFELKSMPGALYRALSLFALRDIDLTKIESRPIPNKTFQYIFYVDFKGNLKETKIKNAIRNLKEISHSVMVFGSYETGRRYDT